MMIDRIDRRRDRVSATGAKGVSGASKSAGAPVAAGRGAGAESGPVDRFAGLGRLIGGAGPSPLISGRAPGERMTIPLTHWEKYDIDHDPLFREAKERMVAYRNLPDPWRRKIDEWGRKVSDEMKYTLAKAIMKG